MALYLGSSGKQKVILNGEVYYLNLFSKTIITNNTLLLSFDDIVLKDAQGVYITAKESE